MLATVGMGLAEAWIILAMLLPGGGGLSTFLGMPPGPRDAALLQCAPADSLVYFEWAERAAGKAGAPGVEGLVEDPEIQQFLGKLEAAILIQIKQSTENAEPEAQTIAEHLPALLKSLLSRPGCFYLSVDRAALEGDKPQADQGIEVPAWAAIAQQHLRVGLIINGGAAADQIEKHLMELLSVLPGAESKAELKNRVIPLPGGGPPLMIHREGRHFILGLGKDVVAAAIQMLAGKSKAPHLGTNERFTVAMRKVTVPRTGCVSWVDVQGVSKAAVAILGPSGAVFQHVATMVGADAVTSVASATGLIDGEVQSRTFVTTGGSVRGVLALAAGRAIRPADFAAIPADASLVWAFSLSPEKILEQVQMLVENADPNLKTAWGQNLQALEAQLGLSLDQDLFPAFGEVWTFYESPATGGLFLTGLVGSLEIRDAAKSRKVREKLVELIGSNLPEDEDEESPYRMELREGSFQGETIYYLNTIGETEMPFTPAFCLTDKQLLVALHPQALKAHLRSQPSLAKSNFSTRLEKAGTPRAGEGIKLPEGELLSLSFVETRSLAKLILPFLPYVVEPWLSKQQAQGVELDAFALPSAAAILPYFGNSVSTMTRTETGILFQNRAACPLPIGSGLGLLVPWFGIRSVSQPIMIEDDVEVN